MLGFTGSSSAKMPRKAISSVWVCCLVMASVCGFASAEITPDTCPPEEGESCELRQCPNQGNQFLQTPTQAVVAYAGCVSALYGNIPLLDRGIFNYTDLATYANILFWPNWTVTFNYTMAATVENTLQWRAVSNLTNPSHNITTLEQYADIYDFYMQNYAEGFPTPPQGVIMAGGIGYDPRLVDDDRWNNDNIFAQRRVMGNNPLQLKRVVFKPTDSNLPTNGLAWEDLIALLNPEFVADRFDQAVRWALDDETTNVTQAINHGELYVLHYPLLAQVRGDPKASGAYANRPMMAPIAFFAATKNVSAPLTPVAIQLGQLQNSSVYTPRSTFFWWTVSKLYVNSADGLVSQIVHHLVNSHFVAEAFAIAAFRQLPETHPVHQLLKHHFEGLIQINSAGFDLLVSENGSVSKVAGFGHDGLTELINIAYKDWSYDKMDFEEDLKARGVDDTNKLPYYPFREDGGLVYDAIKTCVSNYVELFYCSAADVIGDLHLQNFMFEIHTRHFNKGFSSNLTSVAQLKTLLTRIIYVNSMHHAAVNYPVREYGSSVLGIPFAVYRSPEEFTAVEKDVSPNNLDPLVDFLGGFEHATLLAETATQLASLRFSDLFAYGPLMEFADDKARQVIQECRTNLMGTVQQTINTRNDHRANLTLLRYPYMEPRIMPNSIAI